MRDVWVFVWVGFLMLGLCALFFLGYLLGRMVEGEERDEQMRTRMKTIYRPPLDADRIPAQQLPLVAVPPPEELGVNP